jgi:outer membrane receptor for ferrienterochelin and colicin
MRLFPILILLIFIAGRTALGQSIKDTSSKKLNNAKQLNEIKIVGTKDFIEHKIDRVIINVSALLSNAGTNVIDVLNNAPGVEVIDNAITIRGKQGVTVYIDGKQSYLTGNDLYNDLQTLPSGTIDKIELMTNPPASYHVNGNAGVINIITKHNTVKGFNGNVSVS